MDARAAKWGAPPGYYSVMGRLRKLSHEEAVYQIKTRLYAGAVQHIEDVVFIRADYNPFGPITYAAPAATYSGPSAWMLTPEQTARWARIRDSRKAKK